MTSYFNHSWGIAYYNTDTAGNTYFAFSTYYRPNVSVSLPSSVAYNSYANLHVDNFTTPAGGKLAYARFTISSSALSFSKSSTSTNVLSNVSSNCFNVKVYNRNMSTSPVNATVSVVGYTSAGYYSTVAYDKITAVGAPTQQRYSYYTYSSSYYTYYCAASNRTFTYYYNINSLKLSVSTSALGHDSYTTIIPKVSLSHSAAKVTKIVYRVNSPYAVSLSSSRLLTSASAASAAAANIYAYNTSSGSQSSTVTVSVYCGPIVKTANVKFTVDPKPSASKSQILAHGFYAKNAYIGWLDSTDMFTYLQLNNDKIASSTVQVYSGDSNVAYYCSTYTSSSAWLSLGSSIPSVKMGELRTKPASHSGRTIQLANTVKTQSGLTSVAYATVNISATDYSYYMSYYAPRINSASISVSSSILDYNGATPCKVNYSITNDTLKNITWSTSSPYINLSSSGNNAYVYGANTTQLTQSAIVKATITTGTGLQYTCSKSFVVKGAPAPEEPETPETPETPVVPSVSVDEVRENIISYINSQFATLSK